MNRLIVICGPTGTGKTDLALQLCCKLGGEIISADSRQVYQGADIGTNKLNPVQDNRQIEKHSSCWVQQGIKIHLYDIIKPSQSFSVSEYIKMTHRVLQRIIREQKIPFLVGGTGFYLQAFLGERSYSKVEPNWVLRRELESIAPEELFKRLIKLDPSLTLISNSDKHNPRRLIRYLEIVKSTGSLAAGTITHRLPPDLSVIKIGLSAPRDYLYQRADTWTDSIIEHGLIEETQTLLDEFGEESPLLQGLIYAPTVSYLKHKTNKKELTVRIRYQLHSYIRRQLTWFKRDKSIRWFDITKKDLVGKTLRALNNNS